LEVLYNSMFGLGFLLTGVVFNAGQGRGQWDLPVENLPVARFGAGGIAEGGCSQVLPLLSGWELLSVSSEGAGGWCRVIQCSFWG